MRKKKNQVRCGARVAQRSSHAWLQRLTHNLTGDANSPASLRPERGEKIKQLCSSVWMQTRVGSPQDTYSDAY